MQITALQAITSAPKNYDWAFTREVCPDIGKDYRGRTLRLVEWTEDYNKQYQIGRYDSGLCLTIPDQDKLDFNLDPAHPLITLNESPIFNVRKKFKVKLSIDNNDWSERFEPIYDKYRDLTQIKSLAQLIPLRENDQYIKGVYTFELDIPEPLMKSFEEEIKEFIVE